jgi:hypothetical protein
VVLDQAAPFVYAGAQLLVALVLAAPALFVPALRRPVKLAVATALIVLVVVFTFVLAFDRTSPTGPQPLGATLYIGLLGGFIWATVFFILAYLPLALLALARSRR